MRQLSDDLVPADKFDLAAARRATEADARSLEPVVDDLVGWCLDSNWPVARVLGPFLGRLGPPVIPAVRAVLDGTDGPAKYHVLVGIVSEMSPETRRQLRDSLTTLVTSPSEDDLAEELPELAAELLTDTGDGTWSLPASREGGRGRPPSMETPRDDDPDLPDEIDQTEALESSEYGELDDDRQKSEWKEDSAEGGES